MHNEYLDPDRAGLNDEDWGLDYEEVMKHLKEYDSGRWQWSRIHCCTTCKDADLEPYGQQGIELVSVDDDGLHLIAHGGKTEAGLDVCLNLPEEIENDDEAYDKCRDAYLEQAQEIVCGAASAGEWDGDSWYMTFEETFNVPWVLKEDGVTPDYEATVKSALSKFEEVIRPWEDEVVSMSNACNVLAGWCDYKGDRCPVGQPSKGAAWIDPYWEGYDDDQG